MRDLQNTHTKKSLSCLQSLGVLFLTCAIFGSMWWYMVGSQPHVPTYQEQQRQNAADLADATAKLQAFTSANPVVQLKVLSSDWKAENGSMYVEGILANQSTHLFGHVMVYINIYDEAGNQIDTTTDSINYLEPTGKWKFKALVKNVKAGMKYKVVDISGY